MIKIYICQDYHEQYYFIDKNKVIYPTVQEDDRRVITNDSIIVHKKSSFNYHIRYIKGNIYGFRYFKTLK